MVFNPKLHLDQLEDILHGPLPGWDAHTKMINYKRSSVQDALRSDPKARQSAVLILLYPKMDQVHTLLMLRQPYNGVHSAQVSFPGGKKEEEDQDLLATALRETEEETGIAVDDIRILGQLSEVYIKPSGFIVTPFLAWSNNPGQFKPDPVEVSELIEAPVDMLLDEGYIKQKNIYVRAVQKDLNVNYFDVNGHVVWGATAMMISELREIMLTL